ncbi:hypothetical protein N864_11000 [Intrasporangium chromatireducens Q5-1]|uniref:Uncharacterized protein n=1 Tax=Intrasporangium chromatireducens Q5-1 TaxID=584657 RepID=W9GLM8_9MICO|nr:hypothetical protein [Intrasporangium chromatireducens]EWT07161.1 hypothetical protein N864_11000 [Intrasporangium chromatireducens Q5-1]
MQVGSLIFVVIVATWAVYLLQHWIRRREDAAASHTVEQFSEAMRVLEKRSPVPAGGAPGSPLVARRVTPTAHRTPAEVAPMSSSPAPGPARPEPRDQRPAPLRVAVPTVSRWRRTLRGVLLLLALLWVPTAVMLAVLHVLLWVSVPLAVLTFVAVLVWLRLEVRADRARADRLDDEAAAATRSTGDHPSGPRSPQRARRGRPLTSDDTQVIHAPEPAAATESTGHEPAAAAEPATAEPVAAAGAARREARTAAYDFEAELARDVAKAPAPQPAQPQPGPPAPEGTWNPVPVPPPTYTMKAKAEPRLTPAGVPADVFATPEFAEEAEELDERALFVRRAANL